MYCRKQNKLFLKPLPRRGCQIGLFLSKLLIFGSFSSRLYYDFLFRFLDFFHELSQFKSLKRNMKTTTSLHIIIKHQCDRRNRRRERFYVHFEGKFGHFRGLDPFFFKLDYVWEQFGLLVTKFL